MKNIIVTLALLSLPLSAQDSSPDNFTEVKFMTRGYCHAGSAIPDTEALGGFASSRNFPKALPGDLKHAKGKVQLIAQPESVTKFRGKKGMSLLLVNATEETVPFQASDSRLGIVQEALDKDGKWKPVEYLPSSFCGNSHHRVMLPRDHYWEFGAPRYKGPFQTRLRFRIGKTTSNEFEGSVHPDQFRVKEGNQPSNLMDPYDD